MALIFNETTGISAEDTDVIRARLANQWKAAFSAGGSAEELNTDAETPAGQLIDGEAALVAAKDAELLKFANGFNPKTAVGIQQDALGEIYFISRHVAQPTTVTCQCRGLTGTVIPAGSIVQDANGYNYSSTLAATIPASGSVNVIFNCQTAGAIYAAENSLTKIITVIPGWDSVTNAAAGVTGRERESQAEFEQRRFDGVAKNSHGLSDSVGGSVYDLADVVACRVEQNRDSDEIKLLGVTIPGHSIYLSVYGGTPEEIGHILHTKLDAGCGTCGNTSVEVLDEANGSTHVYYYTVATPKSLELHIVTGENALYDPGAIKAAVLENFNGAGLYARAKMGDTIYASRFYQTVISAGLADLVSIGIGDGYEKSQAFALNEMPVLDGADITFEEVSADG